MAAVTPEQGRESPIKKWLSGFPKACESKGEGEGEGGEGEKEGERKKER